MGLDVAALRIFRAVVLEGGITRAADRLGRVQSNITTRVRQLEAELGVDLFLRAGKRLELTPAGRVLLDYADRILDLVEEAGAAVRRDLPSGRFRLGSMESTAAVRLPEPLAEFNRRHPDVTLELSTGNPTQLSAALRAGEIDAALIAEPVTDSGFDSATVFDEQPVIVTAMGETSGDLDLNDPAVDPPGTMIVFEHGCPHRRRLEEWYARRHRTPERIIELGSYHAMMGCVLAGMGAALLPRSVLATFPASGNLRVHSLPPGHDRLRTLLVWRRGLDSPSVRVLAEILTSDR